MWAETKNISLFADDRIIYRKIFKMRNVEKLQSDLERLGDWVEGNEMEIDRNKGKALRFTRARVKDPPNDSLGDQKIPWGPKNS